MNWLVVAPSASAAGCIFVTACLVPAEGSVLHLGFRGHDAVCRRPQKAAHEVSGDSIGWLWAGRAGSRASVNRAAMVRATCAEMQTRFRYECPALAFETWVVPYLEAAKVLHDHSHMGV